MLNLAQNRLLRNFSAKKEIVAWFGLGSMGKFMSRNLAKNPDYKVYGFDPNESCIKRATGTGVILNSNMSEVTQEADWIITSLPNTKFSYDFYVEDQKVFDLVRKDAFMLDTSTIDPSTSAQMTKIARSKGKTFIDAPVTGAVPAAESGT